MTETPTKTRKLIFHTNGLIDPRSWSVLGLSAKESDNPIGCFGSGLKAAISIVNRLGGKIEIQSEGTTYKFGVKTSEFRGAEYQQLMCNGKELPYTTGYAKHWEPWMAFREIVSNTMDEGGLQFFGEPMDEGTSVIVECDEITKCMDNFEDYFVGQREPIAETDDITYYEGRGTIFYRGVKVGVMKGAKYSYEIKRSLDLTEDRTILHEYMIPYYIGLDACMNLKNEKLIRQIVTASGSSFESEITFDTQWSDEFANIVRDIWESAPTTLNTIIQKLIRKKMPDVGWEKLEPTEDEQIYIDKAVYLLKKFGHNITAPIKMVNNDDANNIAFVHEDQIYLTSRAFEKGIFYLTTTLLEEHLHTVGYSDYSRNFQDYLIEQVIKTSAKLHKEVL